MSCKTLVQQCSERVTLYCGDAIETVRSLPDRSIDLICTDPPYYRVKSAAWDRQWKTRDDYLAWLDRLCVEWRRVLRPGGSFYIFASPQMCWHVERIVRTHFTMLSHIRWLKHNGPHLRQHKEALRKPFPNHESILFAEHPEQHRHKKPDDPARRPYRVTKHVPYTETWEFRAVPWRPGKHVCEKTRDLVEHILRSSGSPGCTVLDSFAGSGVVLRVAGELGYQAIGSEIDPEWCARIAADLGTLST